MTQLVSAATAARYGGLVALWFGMRLAAPAAASAARLAALVAAWAATGGHRTLYLAYHTLGRDLR